MTTLKDISIATIASVVTSLATIVGAAFYVDSRYAHADDVSSIKRSQEQWAQQIIIQQNRSIDIIRKQSIEDKLFELESKTKPTTVDKALIQRYERELGVINARQGIQ